MRRVRAKAGKQEDDHGGILPDEILFEIQIRLPHKSLFRFKCVCKAWLSLFQDESFMDLCSTRLRKESTTLRILGRDDDYYNLFSITQDGAVEETHRYHNLSSITQDGALEETPRYCDLLSIIQDAALEETRRDEVPFTVPDKDKTVMPPCRGLFCFRKSKGKLNVWNPTSNEKITLRLPERLREAKRIGFGFDMASKKFKVIGCNEGDSNIQVLTVGEQEWRCVEGGTIDTKYPLIDPIIYLNGVLYWFTTQFVPLTPEFEKVYLYHTANIMRGGQCKITSFDLANEAFGVVSLPSKDDGFVNLGYQLSQVDGCLCLVGYEYKLLDLWILTSTGNWIHQRISLPFEVMAVLDAAMPIRNGEILVQCVEEKCFYLCQYDTTTYTQPQVQCCLLKTTKVTGFTMTPIYLLGKCEDTLVSLKNYM